MIGETKTLVSPVIARAVDHPNKVILVFINEDGSEEHITAAEFHANAMQYGKALAQLGINSDELVILVLKHSMELLYAFWGALYTGAIPSIFPFLTEKLDPILYKERVKKLVANSGAKAVVTYPEFHDELSRLLVETGCQVLNTYVVQNDQDSQGKGGGGVIIGGEKIAFLQHSSGTTGLQKGVALSHQSVLNQIEAYVEAIELSEEDVVVSWLPLYHDMGLIAGFVMPIISGIPLILMSPFQWVRDPKILLKAIHNHRGTLCWLPNFAYNHIARSIRPSSHEGFDLSSCRAMINCSEPVYAHSHNILLEKLNKYNFNKNSLAVSYAMAENTFAVTQTNIHLPPNIDRVNTKALQEKQIAEPARVEQEGATSIVSCGAPIRGTEIKIVDDQFKECNEREVGEIAIKSNCMLSGYHNRSDITKQAFHNGWYHTGDMGYIADGELYITGRKKDLIIVGGKNIYPQDLEAIANQITGIYPGRAVAFGLFDERIGSESVIMVCELHDQSGLSLQDIERTLRTKIVQQTEITLADVRLVNRRWLIKTSSGKISRADNRQKYLTEFRS